jgi:hypothetical protein
MKHSATMQRQKISRRDLNFFFTIVVNKDEQSLQSAMEQVNELTSGNKSGVESAKVLKEDSPSRDQLQNGRRKFKEQWCKELLWLKINCTTGIAMPPPKSNLC